MANTTIQLKRSGTASNVPVSLAYGEISLNYADGLLYYKNSAGYIVSFSSGGGNSFGTVNANGTLVVAGGPNSIFSLVPGSGIAITGDAITDKITISATGGGGGGNTTVVVSNTTPASPTQGNLWWNTDLGKLFIYYTDVNGSQ